MDFRQITQPNNGRPPVTPQAPVSPEHRESKGVQSKPKHRSWLQLFSGILLVGIAVLLACVAVAINRGGSDNENKYVDTSKYQAVFLNNGQVYFGHIADLNNSYLRMTGIYYLTQSGNASGSSTSSSSSNYSLVKLGCQQIHDPLDEMVINRDQVTFWENLQSKGKVVKSIQQFQQQNPNGPDCSQVSSQTQASSSNAQGSATDTTK